MSTSRQEKRSTRRPSCKDSTAGCTRMGTRDTTSCRVTSVWWAVGPMRGENLMRHCKRCPRRCKRTSPAAIGECYCSRLFKLEQAFAELTPEERYKKRLEQEKPVLDALLSWANEIQAKAAPKSALGKAIHYLLEQRPYLTRYLEDGRLELSNNRAERSIKPFVMGRKNWLFANTPGGAQASAVIYSLMETAKENGLDPYRYLLWVLRNAPQLSETDETWAEKLLPANAPEECYMPHK